MRYLKLFENFEQPEGSGEDTYWEVEIKNKPVRVTLTDVLNYLDNIIELNPEDIEHLLIDVEREPERVDAADLKYPIILLSKGGEYTSILDGQHRVVKALRDGVPVKARILDLDSAPEKFKNVFG
jgi:hypothetical protein